MSHRKLHFCYCPIRKERRDLFVKLGTEENNGTKRWSVPVCQFSWRSAPSRLRQIQYCRPKAQNGKTVSFEDIKSGPEDRSWSLGTSVKIFLKPGFQGWKKGGINIHVSVPLCGIWISIFWSPDSKQWNPEPKKIYRVKILMKPSFQEWYPEVRSTWNVDSMGGMLGSYECGTWNQRVEPRFELVMNPGIWMWISDSITVWNLDIIGGL